MGRVSFYQGPLHLPPDPTCVDSLRAGKARWVPPLAFSPRASSSTGRPQEAAKTCWEPSPPPLGPVGPAEVRWSGQGGAHQGR